MSARTTVPAYFPGTDVRTNDEDIEIRVFASGDDRAFWDVEFQAATGRWHAVPTNQCKAVLAHIETNDVSAWGDIMATARTNPTLAA